MYKTTTAHQIKKMRFHLDLRGSLVTETEKFRLPIGQLRQLNIENFLVSDTVLSHEHSSLSVNAT